MSHTYVQVLGEVADLEHGAAHDSAGGALAQLQRQVLLKVFVRAVTCGDGAEK